MYTYTHVHRDIQKAIHMFVSVHSYLFVDVFMFRAKASEEIQRHLNGLKVYYT